MKKINLLIALATLICTTASAQFNNSFGIKAGANYSQFRSDRDIFEGKIGYYAGGYFNFGLSDRIGITPELLLANQGTKTSTVVSETTFLVPESGISESNLNELTLLLPINLQYEFVGGVFVEAGLQAGYVVKRTNVFTKDTFMPSLEGQKQTISNFDRFDLGLNGGIGLDLMDRWELHLRYSHGLIERDLDYKTSVFSLGLGYKI
jgi:opacity protein-like surface antigen